MTATAPRPRQRGRHSLLYRWYMRSRLWRVRRWYWIASRGHRCERCGRAVADHRWTADRGEAVAAIHHVTYARLGRERGSDVLVLCPACHYAVDPVQMFR